MVGPGITKQSHAQYSSIYVSSLKVQTYFLAVFPSVCIIAFFFNCVSVYLFNCKTFVSFSVYLSFAGSWTVCFIFNHLIYLSNSIQTSGKIWKHLNMGNL